MHPIRTYAAKVSTPDHRRRGPRGGDTDLRATLLSVARKEFTANGYRGTPLRRIATEAGVDASLLAYYFGSKQRLFIEAMELPISPGELVAEAVAVPVDALGETLVRQLLAAWAGEGARRAAEGVVHAMVLRPDVATALGEYATEHLIGPIAQALGTPDATYRATLVVAQLAGLVLAHELVRAPLFAEDPARLIADLAPVIQNYLTGELPSGRPVIVPGAGH